MKSLGYHLRQLLLVFSHHLGALLMGFGALLVIIGLGVRLAREYQVTRAESALSAPAFDEVLLPGVSGPAGQGLGAHGVSTEEGSWPAAWPTVTAMATAMATEASAARLADAPATEASVVHLLDAPAFEGERLPTPDPLAGGRRQGRMATRHSADGAAAVTTAKPDGTTSAGAVPRGAADARSAETPPVWDPVAATETPDPMAARAALPMRLVIPSIGLDTPVVTVGWEARVVNGEFRGNQWQTADGAAGYHRTSALPGQVGNTVISGHNNIGGAVFKDLHRLKLGDRVEVYTRQRRLDFVVAANFIVEEAGVSVEQRRANAKWIGPTADVRLTLITCFPPWGNSHRTIVIAIPVSEATAVAP